MYVVVCDHNWVFVTADNGRKVEVCTECDEERIDFEEEEDLEEVTSYRRLPGERDPFVWPVLSDAAKAACRRTMALRRYQH